MFKKNIILVYDEAYYHFGSKSEIKNSIKKKSNCYENIFKSMGLPSIRLGFLVTNRKLCEYISKCRSLVETNALSYQIAMWALNNRKYSIIMFYRSKKGLNIFKEILQN